MDSMTGFGQGRAEGAHGVATAQISSVNQRGCKISLRSELRDLALEEKLRARVQESLQRGAITVQVGFSPPGGGSLGGPQLAAAWRELALLAEQLGAPVPALEQVARLPGLGRTETDPAGATPLIEAALEQALAACAGMRAREGRALLTILQGQASRLRELRAALAPAAAARLAKRRESLQQRLGEVLREQVPEEVLVRELALHADRIDITEELDRLGSHLDQLDRLLLAPGQQGRAIEFLLQEVGREINTTGAKANDAAVQNLVIEAKGVLEQLKEQVANVA